MWYSFGFVESVQGVRCGDVVWQVRRQCSSLVLGAGCPAGLTRWRSVYLADHAYAHMMASPCACTTPATPQIGFGSGFKCNSVVWRALRPIKEMHKVGGAGAGAALCSTSAGGAGAGAVTMAP